MSTILIRGHTQDKQKNIWVLYQMYHLNLLFDMKRIFLFIVSLSFFSCDEETPIKDNFVVEGFLFQGEKVDDIKIKETKLWNSDDTTDVIIDNANVKLYANGNHYDLSFDNIQDNGERFYMAFDQIYHIKGMGKRKLHNYYGRKYKELLHNFNLLKKLSDSQLKNLNKLIYDNK